MRWFSCFLQLCWNVRRPEVTAAAHGNKALKPSLPPQLPLPPKINFKENSTFSILLSTTREQNSPQESKSCWTIPALILVPSPQIFQAGINFGRKDYKKERQTLEMQQLMQRVFFSSLSSSIPTLSIHSLCSHNLFLSHKLFQNSADTHHSPFFISYLRKLTANQDWLLQ